jgi:hypothetical protein
VIPYHSAVVGFYKSNGAWTLAAKAGNTAVIRRSLLCSKTGPVFDNVRPAGHKGVRGNSPAPEERDA